MICVAISFDDGYVRHYEYAKLLYKLDVPATFFIITGLNEYNGEKLLANKPELVRDIVDMGHEVGSHTHTHPDLTKVGRETIEDEFLRSTEALRSWGIDYELGIAYPYGSFNNDVLDLASKYFIYGRTMGSYNRWNEKPTKYAIGGMGIRHLPKLIIKAITKRTRLVSIVMHRESLSTIKLMVDYLRMFNAKFLTLNQAVRECLST